MKCVLILATLLILTACAAATDSPTPSPSPTATATPSTTPTPSNTPPPTDTPAIQPLSSNCDVGGVIFSARGDVEAKKPQSGLYLACADGSSLYQILPVEKLMLPNTSTLNLDFAVSPDGKQVAFTVVDVALNVNEGTRNVRGEIYILALADYSFEKIFATDYGITEVNWSPDSEYLVYLTTTNGEDVVEALHINTLVTSRIIDGSWFAAGNYAHYTLYELDLLPDGERIYYAGERQVGVMQFEAFWNLADVSCNPQTHLCEAVFSQEIQWIPHSSYRISWTQGVPTIAGIYFEDASNPEMRLDLRSPDGTLIKKMELNNRFLRTNQRDAVLSSNGEQIAFIASIKRDISPSVLILSLEDMSVVNLTEDPMFDDVMPGEVYWLP